MSTVEQMIGKNVRYNNKDYIIDCYEINTFNHNVEQLYFGLKLTKGSSTSKSYISTKSFENKSATTNDVELLNFVTEYNKDFNVRLNNALAKENNQKELALQKKIQEEKEEQKRMLLVNQETKERAIKKAKEDARNKVNTLYNIFTNIKYMMKALEYNKVFRDNYTVAYEEEKRLMKKERLVQVRANQSTLSDYPGDVEELIKWMRKNILRVDVFAPTDKIDNEQSAVDVLNERDNTDYKVKVRPGQYIAYEAFFKNQETAPREFLEWKVSKHDYTSIDLNKRVMDHPMSIKTGKLTCNSLVKELLYSDEYRFHVGKYI